MSLKTNKFESNSSVNLYMAECCQVRERSLGFSISLVALK